MTSPPRDRVPVRRRLTLLRDGSSLSAALVFCGAQQRSVSIERCVSCPYGGGVEADAGGLPEAVSCACSLLPSSPPVCAAPTPAAPPGATGGGVERVAASLPVGLALLRTVVCIRDDVPLRTAARMLLATPAAGATPIVDAQQRLVGLLPRPTASLGESDSFADSLAVDHAREPTLVVEERQTLGAAFTTMGARHARELVVVGDHQQVVGTLRDVDALRFVAYVARTGLRPARGWAA